jgi:hypothetical protein
VSSPQQSTSDLKRAKGSPTKDFFVRMITRDITLVDCILDLLDNAIDGARRSIKRQGSTQSGAGLAGYRANLVVGNERFVVDDNCGGISLTDAVEYAFHFGRRKDAPHDVDHSIGLYGIGMKRAIFKIGRKARIESRPPKESFAVEVDVAAWEQSDDDWDFDLSPLEGNEEIGTRIVIDDLYPQIANSFADPTFVNELIRTMARDYAFVIDKGFSMSVNGTPVPRYEYRLKDGEDVTPAVVEYTDDGVTVRIVAGLMKELDADIPDELRLADTEAFGWYVVCNDRVVLAGDKSDLTVWGQQGFNVWHPQYRGFAGFVFFESDDPKKLPWTTTKREVDVSEPLYLRALARMKDVTSQFTAYTNQRKADPGEAKKAELAATSVSIASDLKTPRSMKLPKVEGKSPGEETVTVAYQRPRGQVKEIAEALGNFNMSAREVGIRTFEYYRKMELGKS